MSRGKGVHIAQLMRGSSGMKNPSATVVDEVGVERVISKAEERQREKDLRRLVEEKMNGGSIVSPTVSPKLAKERQKTVRAEEKHRRREDSARLKPQSAMTKPSPGKRVEVAVGSGEKKISGLRRQLSKLGFGGILVSRQQQDDRKAYRNVETVVFNEKGVIAV
jgi:hypothetical protein